MNQSRAIPKLYRHAEDAPAPVIAAATIYEDGCGHKFETLTVFSEEVLRELHDSAEPHDPAPQHGVVFHIASTSRPEAAIFVRELGVIANQASRRQEDHDAYFKAVLEIYALLPGDLRKLVASEDAFVIAPQREGRDIAFGLGLLPPGRHLTPIAKRIQLPSGLAVGLSGMATISSEISHLVIIDGVIASGATIIAILEASRASVTAVKIFTAHATDTGLLALRRYAIDVGMRLDAYVGHVSGTLNSSRYALNDDGQLTVGDLGDLISPAASR